MDLHVLPKIRDSWSHLYLERCTIDQEAKAIAYHNAEGRTRVPVATLALLMLGPGTSITHAAMRTLAEHGCTVLWTGEQAVRCYAQGLGETRSARRLLRQARLWADARLHLAVVRQMYQMRFAELLEPELTLQQIRGREGVRVREAYARASRETGVAWSGRAYKPADWAYADPVNRALSAANSCLYGVCHAAILSAGYSPALGFIHTGKLLSFVWDIADLYKADLTIPAAFAATAEDGPGLESRVRRQCRDVFREHRLLARIVEDIERVLAVEDAAEGEGADDENDTNAGWLWDPEEGVVAGGVDYGAPASTSEAASGEGAEAEQDVGADGAKEGEG